MSTSEDLSNTYKGLLLWVNSICLALSLLAFVFIIWFRNKPILVLSQRGYLLVITVSLVITNGAYFAGSATASDCWVHYTLANTAMNVFFATLTAREYNIYQLHRSIKSNSQKRLNQIAGPVYVCIMGLVALLLTIFVWLKPYTDYGVKPCQRSPNETVPDEMQEISQTYNYWFVLNHVLAFVMAFVSRKVPSICGDAQIIFFLSIIGILYVIASTASYNTYNGDTRTILRITYTVLDFLVQLIALFMLIFKRTLYLNLTKTEVVKKFLAIDFDVYQAIAGTDDDEAVSSVLQSTRQDSKTIHEWESFSQRTTVMRPQQEPQLHVV